MNEAESNMNSERKKLIKTQLNLGRSKVYDFYKMKEAEKRALLAD
jgi:hypothetical protein